MNYDVDAIYAQRAESACKENGFDYQAMKADGYGDRDIYQGVLEQQVPTPEVEETESTTPGDYSRSLAIGLNRFGQTVGRTVDVIGNLDPTRFFTDSGEGVIDRTGQKIEQYYKEKEQEDIDDLSPAMKQAQELKYTTDVDESWRDAPLKNFKSIFQGDAWKSPAKVAGSLLQSAPSTAVGMGTGMGITHGLIKESTKLVASGLVKKGMSNGLAGVVGGFIGEGTTASIESGKEIYDMVLNAPYEVISETPEYQKAWSALADEQLSPQEKEKQTRELIADHAAIKSMATVFAMTGALGSVSGHYMGKIIGGNAKGGVARKVLTEGGLETLQETPQSGYEILEKNLQAKRYVNPNQDIWEGVKEGSTAGGVQGFVMGGVMGGGGAVISKSAKQNLLDDNAGLNQDTGFNGEDLTEDGAIPGQEPNRQAPQDPIQNESADLEGFMDNALPSEEEAGWAQDIQAQRDGTYQGGQPVQALALNGMQKNQRRINLLQAEEDQRQAEEDYALNYPGVPFNQGQQTVDRNIEEFRRLKRQEEEIAAIQYAQKQGPAYERENARRMQEQDLQALENEEANKRRFFEAEEQKIESRAMAGWQAPEPILKDQYAPSKGEQAKRKAYFESIANDLGDEVASPEQRKPQRIEKEKPRGIPAPPINNGIKFPSAMSGFQAENTEPTVQPESTQEHDGKRVAVKSEDPSLVIEINHPISGPGLKDKGQQEWVDAKVKSLGSIESVDKFYPGDSVVDTYAKARAREVFSEKNEEQTTNYPKKEEVALLPQSDTETTPTVKKNLTVAPGQAVTWQDKKGNEFSGTLVAKAKEGGQIWKVERDDGKPSLVNENNITVTETDTKSAPSTEKTPMQRLIEKEETDTQKREEIKTGIISSTEKKPLITLMKKDTRGGKERISGVMIHKSTKYPGKYQLTRWDEDGLSGDSHFNTKDQAVDNAIMEGFHTLDDGTFKEISTSERFDKGNQDAAENQKWNEEQHKKHISEKDTKSAPSANITAPSENEFNPLNILLNQNSKTTDGDLKSVTETEIDSAIRSIQNEINDWSSREYKKNKSIVSKGGAKDDLNSSPVSVSVANERRRQRNIESRKKAVSDLEKIKDRIKAGEDEFKLMGELLDSSYQPIADFAKQRLESLELKEVKRQASPTVKENVAVVKNAAHPDFNTMVQDAARWRGAAIKADQLMIADKKARLKHNNMTTKGDLDAYLIKKYGIDPVQAREVSNELTRGNIPNDVTADLQDFKDEPFVKHALSWEPSEQEAKPSEQTEGGKPEVVTDAADRQRIQNSLIEGESILKTGMFNGIKKDAGYLKGVQKAVDNARAKLGTEKPNADKSSPTTDPEQQTESKSPDEVKKGVQGKKGTTYLNDNTPIEFQYEVIEIDDLVTSNYENMNTNPDFPAELQNRDRSRKALIAQVEEIAQKLIPQKLGENTNISDGAPVISPDSNVVESGNGRTVAIRKANKTEKGPEYHRWLLENSYSFGIDDFKIKEMNNPVLIRRRITPVEDLVAYVKKANKGTIAELSPAEQAVDDANSLTSDDIGIFRPDANGNIGASSNQGFIKRFLGKMDIGEQAKYLTEDGFVTRQLIDRIQVAIFQKAYGSDALLKMAAEETNPDMKNILNGLGAAAGSFLKARGMNNDFVVSQGIVGHIVEGIEFLRRATKEYSEIKANHGKSAIQIQLKQALSQGDIFGTEVSPEVEQIATILADNIRSGKRIGEFLYNIGVALKAYISDLSQMEMFGTKQEITSLHLITMSKEKLEAKYEE